MEASLKKLQEQCARFGDELKPFGEKFGEFYKSAGVISEKAGSETVDAGKFGDFSAKLSAFQTDVYNMSSQLKEYGQTLAELAVVFSYGTIPAGKPRIEFVSGVKDSCMLYVTKILTKSSDDAKTANREWRESILAILQAVDAAIKNPQASSSSGGSTGGSAGGMSALLSSLNKGDSSALTSGLRKVDDSQKTHKNPALRSGSTVTTQNTKKPAHVGSDSGPIIAGDPVFEKDSRSIYTGKFLHDSEHSITGPIATKVYISRSVGARFIVENKVNTVVLQKCHGCLVHIKAGVIATVELVECKDCHIQCDVSIPLAQLDKSTGCIIYAKESDLDNPEKSHQGFSSMKVITSLCDSINVHHCDDSMFHLTEMPLPSVFCSKYDQKSKKWITVPQTI